MADNKFETFFLGVNDSELPEPEEKQVARKKSYSFKPRLKPSPDKVYAVGRIDVYIAYISALILSVIYGIIVSSGVINKLSSEYAEYAIFSAVTILVFLIPAFIFCKTRQKDGFRLLRFSRFPSSLTWYILLSTLLLILLIASEEFSLAYFFSASGKNIGANLFSSNDTLLIILVYAILPAICEEIFFRGVLQTELTRIAGGFAGILVSALAYAIIKLDFEYFVVYFTTGIIIGAVMHITGSIFPCIFMHAINGIFTLGFSAQLNFIASERAGNLFVIIILTICVFIVLLFCLKMLETICIRKAAAIDIAKLTSDKDTDDEKIESSSYRFYSAPFRLTSDTGYTLHKILRILFSPAIIVSLIVFLFYTVV